MILQKSIILKKITGKPRKYGRVLNSKKNEVDLVPGHSRKGRGVKFDFRAA